MVDEISFGYVWGSIFLAVADTVDDPDRDPDLVAPTGATVIFTPVQPQRRVQVPGERSALVLKQRVDCVVNADGIVVDPTGATGVWLVTGQYDVRIQTGSSGDPAPFKIQVTSAHTESSPLDLIKVLPVSPRPVPVPQWQVLTMVEYEALPEYAPATLYLIGD